MRSLYLTGNVAISMGKAGLKIRENGNESITSPPYFEPDTIVLQNAFGYVSIAALRMLTSLRVQIVLLDYQGRLMGHMTPRARRTGNLFMSQYRAAANPEKRLAIAKAVAIRGYRRRGRSPPFQRAGSLSELVQMESRVADSYWTDWRGQLARAWPTHDFDGRKNPRYATRMRAVTQVNAVLNLSYEALLKPACRTICFRMGLRPEIGFLHTENPHDAEPFIWDLEELGRG